MNGDRFNRDGEPENWEDHPEVARAIRESNEALMRQMLDSRNELVEHIANAINSLTATGRTDEEIRGARRMKGEIVNFLKSLAADFQRIADE